MVLAPCTGSAPILNRKEVKLPMNLIIKLVELAASLASLAGEVHWLL